MVQYYAVYVLAGKENKARDLLLSRAITHKHWQNTIFEILIPTEKAYVTSRGKRKIVDKKVFPGYLFVKMYLDKDSEYLVKSTEGITGFVNSAGRPTPVAEEEMQRILKHLSNTEESPKSQFKANDVISIIEGPFVDYSGTVESVDESKGKLKAFVQVFGRNTLVEFDLKDVVLEK